MITAKEVLDRIWDGRGQLRKIGVDPALRDVRVILGVDAWTAIMTALPNLRHAAHYDYGQQRLYIFGTVAERDPNVSLTDIRFRSEVSV